ncbi:PIG-L family deacetylase [Propionibacteriaceae bacterium Y1923]|uniref:PIG-L family deacetylase n=1 Tax=Aestuariimicrobium sp. Y1814 TaxID=3418742 RepID=UPI003C24F5AD
MLIADFQRVLFVHAHPDDETLATGALIAQLTADGVQVDLVTCTRGERGELVPGVLPGPVTPQELSRIREGELATAVAHLGIEQHAFLGTPPASRDGQARTYEDSGMEWVRPGLAGPAADASPAAFSVQPVDDLVADLSALVAATEPQAVLGYDAGGGYGHPDHVRAHEVARLTAERAGLPFLEFVGWLDPEAETDADSFEWQDYPEHLPALLAAHDAHRTQFTRDADLITHVGGQQHPLVTRVGLRRG